MTDEAEIIGVDKINTKELKKGDIIFIYTNNVIKTQEAVKQMLDKTRTPRNVFVFVMDVNAVKVDVLSKLPEKSLKIISRRIDSILSRKGDLKPVEAKESET